VQELAIPSVRESLFSARPFCTDNVGALYWCGTE
jgi:hypothetical protein